jgi:hypothetical protein
MANIVMARSSARITVLSGHSITVFTQDAAVVSQDVSGVITPLGTVTASQQMFGPFVSGATIVIDAGALSAIYATGSSPVLREMIGHRVQRAPIAINAAGTIPESALANGLISSNSLLGITCTLPTGTAMDAVSDFRMDDSFDWSVMAVGLFGFTVGASAGHTIVGAATVGSGSSGEFRTRKTAANTFITYRIG